MAMQLSTKLVRVLLLSCVILVSHAVSLPRQTASIKDTSYVEKDDH